MDSTMLFRANAELENIRGNIADDLVARAQNGDDEAFGQIFEHHHRFVYKFVYTMIGEPCAAEEVTQETFLAAYKNIRSLRGDASLQTWLGGIAKNLVYKSFRTSRREKNNNGTEEESLLVADENFLTPDRQFLNKELNQIIGASLKKLDDDKRLVFTLKELQNLSYKEISEMTGSAIPKLKTDLHRAKIEMRKMLHSYGGEK